MSARVPSAVPEGLLYALLFLGPLAFGAVEPWSRAGLEVLAFSLALAAYLRGRGALTPAADNFWLLPGAFAALAAVQLLAPAAADGPRPSGPFTAAPYETEQAALLWAAYAAVAFAVPRVVSGHEAARRFARAAFGLGLAVAALGLLQAATGTDRIYWVRDAGWAFFGPFYNRDHAATLLLVALAFGIGLRLSLRRSSAPDGLPKGSAPGRAFVAGGAGLLALALLFTASRGALLALILTAAAMGLLAAPFASSARVRRRRALWSIAAAAFVLFAAFQHVGAGADAGARVEHSIAARLFIYGDAVRWWRDSPWFGTGLGSFATVYPSYQNLDLPGVVEHAHGDWLELLLETGVWGLLAAALGAVLVLAGGHRAWREARSSEMRALVGGALAAAAAFAIHSLFEFPFQIPANAVLLVAVSGFLLSAPVWADKAARAGRPAAPAEWTVPVAAVCWLGLCAAAILPAAGRPMRPDARLLGRAAAGLYGAAGEPGAEDPETLRASLGYALGALELRPYDSSILGFASGALRKLGRPGDAAELGERAKALRFLSSAPRREDPGTRRLEAFRAIAGAKEKKTR